MAILCDPISPDLGSRDEDHVTREVKKLCYWSSTGSFQNPDPFGSGPQALLLTIWSLSSCKLFSVSNRPHLLLPSGLCYWFFPLSGLLFLVIVELAGFCHSGRLSSNISSLTDLPWLLHSIYTPLPGTIPASSFPSHVIMLIYLLTSVLSLSALIVTKNCSIFYCHCPFE